MSGTPYVPFYTSDFLGGTSGMTAATKGVYITLLCLMYEAEAPLPQSWDTLARRCGSTLPAFKKAIEALQDDGKVTIVDAGIWSEKCEKHLALRRDRQSSAKAAAKTRWQKTQQKQGRADATASIPQCQPEPEPEPEPEPDNISKEMYIIASDKDEDRPKKLRLPEDWVPDDDDVQYAISLKLTEAEIKEIADDFHAYWRDRTDAGGKKSARGWKQTWKNRCRDQAPRFIRNRGMAATPFTGRHGQGGGIAGAVARRQFGD